MRGHVRGAAIAALALSVIGVPACSDDGDHAPATTTTTEFVPISSTRGVRDVLARDSQFARFVELADLADLWAALPDGDVTLLVPTSTAFDAVDPAIVAAWRADPGGELRTVLSRHVVPGSLSLADLVAAARGPATIAVASGESVPIGFDGAAVDVGGAPVAKYDIRTRRGYVHVLDGVISTA